MRHDLGNMLLMMRAVGWFRNPKFRTSFRICSRNDLVEPLFIAVDQQDLRRFFQSPTILNTPAENNSFQMIFRGKSGLNMFRVERISVVGVQPFRNASVLAPMLMCSASCLYDTQLYFLIASISSSSMNGWRASCCLSMRSYSDSSSSSVTFARLNIVVNRIPNGHLRCQYIHTITWWLCYLGLNVGKVPGRCKNSIRAFDIVRRHVRLHSCTLELSLGLGL